MATTRLRKLRKQTGLSAYAFGGELVKRDIVSSLSHYYQLEIGKTQPRFGTLVNIATALAEHLGQPLEGILLQFAEEEREAQ